MSQITHCGTWTKVESNGKHTLNACMYVQHGR